MTRSVLACSSPGGHFKQLVSLVPRVPDLGEVVWLTSDVGLSRDLLVAAGRGGDELIDVPYAAPRDLPNLARDALVARRLLRNRRFDLAISTGAGIAVAVLPAARVRGVRACFLESATRADGPSLSGRILERVPGIDLFTQNAGYDAKWRDAGTVHDGFVRGPDRTRPRLAHVVVTLGTIRPYGFERLIERLLRILPDGAEVLWQTGATDVTRYGIDGRAGVAGPELERAIADADVVIAHAGTGTALTAFERGRCPILVPRRAAHGEHVDDHQVATASSLAARGLGLHVEADDLGIEHLEDAARRTIMRNSEPPPLRL